MEHRPIDGHIDVGSFVWILRRTMQQVDRGVSREKITRVAGRIMAVYENDVDVVFYGPPSHFSKKGAKFARVIERKPFDDVELREPEIDDPNEFWMQHERMIQENARDA